MNIIPHDQILRDEINLALDNAENIWNQVEEQLILEYFEKGIKSYSDKKIITKIPGFPFLEDGKPQVADFIALVLDIRNSSNHLTQAISEKKAKASQLERVLYETTAINTAGISIIEEYKGGITEFLGDGFLALFQAKNPKDVYSAHNAAKKCMRITKDIINDILYQRYLLPPLSIGIGMAYSQAIVTIIGTGNNLHPKAIGECVYRASKLSDAKDEIQIDDRLKIFWPTEKNGILKFISFDHKNNFKAYKILKNEK